MAEMRDAFKKAGVGGGMQERKCEECGKPFVPKEPQHRRCPDCAREAAARKGGPASAHGHAGGHAERGLPVPAGYPDYFSGEGTLRPEYLTGLAEDLAKAFGNADPKLTSHQLRAFYSHAKRREASARNGRPWGEVYTELVKMAPIAAERKAKGTIPAEFEEFVRRNVNRAKDEAGFLEGFIEHFQAVVAYCEGTLKKH